MTDTQLATPAPAREKQTNKPRTVQFVVDRETIVPAEVIREHADGSLDLKGKFLQHGFKTVKESDTNPKTGQSADFDMEVPEPNETIVTRLRVRQADEDKRRLGKCDPGSWFD